MPQETPGSQPKKKPQKTKHRLARIVSGISATAAAISAAVVLNQAPPKESEKITPTPAPQTALSDRKKKKPEAKEIRHSLKTDTPSAAQKLFMILIIPTDTSVLYDLDLARHGDREAFDRIVKLFLTLEKDESNSIDSDLANLSGEDYRILSETIENGVFPNLGISKAEFWTLKNAYRVKKYLYYPDDFDLAHALIALAREIDDLRFVESPYDEKILDVLGLNSPEELKKRVINNITYLQTRSAEYDNSSHDFFYCQRLINDLKKYYQIE